MLEGQQGYAFQAKKPVLPAHLKPDEAQVAQLRGRRVLAFAGIGATLALWRLDIPWTDLWSAPGLALFSFEDMRPDLPLITSVVALTGDTLMMAWVATVR